MTDSQQPAASPAPADAAEVTPSAETVDSDGLLEALGNVASQVVPLSVADGLEAWDQLIRKVTRLLVASDTNKAWAERFCALTDDVRELALNNPDMALYVLTLANGISVDAYSAQHAMVCLVIAELAANWLEWPEVEKLALARAALSMNVSITSLQDSLARQSGSMSEAQRQLVTGHATASAELITKAGVDDRLWLYAVQNHHTVSHDLVGESAEAGPRTAELLRRVDIYTAKLSRRGSRVSVTPATAARDACLDAAGNPDSIGATLLRIVGLYPPGTFVELANGETAVVIKRGEKAHTPMVASLRRQDGGLLMQPVGRDTQRPAFAVRRGLQPSQVRVQFDHRRALACAT
jgi:hypothetical protein